MNYEELYDNNREFHAYVDKYCVKHQIPVCDALLHIIVRLYGDQLIKRQAEIIIEPAETTISCGGC